MLRVLTLSTLYPDRNRPVHGTFVERQTIGLAAHPDVELQVVVPRGLPPFPVSRHPNYRAVAGLPAREVWNGLTVYRPRFLHVPKIGARYDTTMMVRALKPLFTHIRQSFAFDVIDAEFFFPDGPTAIALGKHFNVPVSIKARGSDIHLWGVRPDTARQVIAAGRAATEILAVSAALKADMIALGMPQEHIKVHYTGVDLELFKPFDQLQAKEALGITGPLVVSIGALNKRKGQALVMEALPQLPGVTLALAGDGPERATLQALAAKLGVGDRVLLLGTQSRAQVAQWLAAADVMALPSESEGLANAWVEALASGAPVVTCDVGGAREVITSDGAGRLVERSVEGVVTGIADLLANPPSRDSVRGFAARFTWDANTSALYAHLSGLAAAYPSR